MESIDIFDTAIFRDVYEPKDIFKLLEKINGVGFCQKRIDAENKAHNRYKFPTIKQIYEYIPGYNMEKEMQMELDHTYPNKEILDMYNSNPSNYVFISDMYLPSTFLIQMLEKCGYKNPRVFVSCEEKCNKGSGILFEKVQRRLGKLTKHYGDNYRSDVEGCVKQGIEPVFKQALHKINLNLPMVKNPLLKKYSAALTMSNERAITKLAKWYAPLIYEFTKWVISKRKPGQHIYFLSRDMFMPYIISQTIMKQTDIHYLYCSRRSLAPLYLQSREPQLLNKMKIVLTPEELNITKKRGADECLRYLKESGIKNGDIIVDVGYSGSTQRVIEESLHIKLKGLYMQLDQVPHYKTPMDMEMYLKRYVLLYRFLCEFILTSPEDCIEGYKNGKPITSPDHEQRKIYAKHINTLLIDTHLFNKIDRMELTVFDVEQMLIHIQNNLTPDMMKLFNEPILTNRTKTERGINFDKKKILNGKLLDCYKKSYAKPLFKEMLLADPDLCSLISILPD